MSTEEKCLQCGELKTACKCEKKEEKKEEIKGLSVTIDTKNVEAVLKRMTEVEAENRRLTEETKKIMEAKQKVETSLEEEKTIKEDYESKLKIVAEQKFTEKKGVIMTEAKKLGLDDARLKQIEEGLKSPEDLKATEFLIQTLTETLAKGAKEHEEQEKKEKEAMTGAKGDKGAGGEVGLRPEDVEKEKTGGKGEISYESHAAMIRDLRKKSHSTDPEEAAYAKSVLGLLFEKWTVAVKKQYEGKAQGGLGSIGPANIKEQPSLKDITKKGGEAI